MLSTKKLLYKTLDKLANLFGTSNMPSVQMTNSGSVAAGANSGIVISFPAGYDDGTWRCLAVNSLNFTGTYADYIVLRGFSISNSGKTVTVHLKSTATSSTITYNCNVYALFTKVV